MGRTLGELVDALAAGQPQERFAPLGQRLQEAVKEALSRKEQLEQLRRYLAGLLELGERLEQARAEGVVEGWKDPDIAHLNRGDLLDLEDASRRVGQATGDLAAAEERVVATWAEAESALEMEARRRPQ